MTKKEFDKANGINERLEDSRYREEQLRYFVDGLPHEDGFYKLDFQHESSHSDMPLNMAEVNLILNLLEGLRKDKVKIHEQDFNNFETQGENT